jgi:hypothetical protein
MKIITFSRYFPVYHPKAGQPTEFVQKILLSLIEVGHISMSKSVEIGQKYGFPGFFSINDVRKLDLSPKHHTIRAGNRWKEGEWFSPASGAVSPTHRSRLNLPRRFRYRRFGSLK